jgi:hypothetical protein
MLVVPMTDKAAWVAAARAKTIQRLAELPSHSQMPYVGVGVDYDSVPRASKYTDCMINADMIDADMIEHRHGAPHRAALRR